MIAGVIAVAAVGFVLRMTQPTSSSERKFQVGDRVRVLDSRFPDYWANGATGVIGIPSETIQQLAGGWHGHVRLVSTVDGMRPFYWVVLDEPRHDADGDGPYTEAEIDERALALAAAPPP